ncbi:MAG: phage portal protein [Fusobacteriaceae bacterium]|jgi:lambda family phage portal protein|nr:phage portal protein [Fusobacteriaceae bacterium]
MNFISKLAPRWAHKRENAKRELKIENAKLKIVDNIYGYSEAGASTKKNAFKHTWDWLNTPKEDIGDNHDLLTARSRQAFMAGGYGRGAVSMIVESAIGTGLKLKSNINNDILKFSEKERNRIQNEIEHIFNWWSDGTECDIEQQQRFEKLQFQMLITKLVDGEGFVLFQYRKRDKELFETKIKFIDSARCCSWKTDLQNLENGVETDNDGRPIAYWFINDNKTMEQIRIPVRDKYGNRHLLVLIDKERIGQRRGVPLLAPVLEILQQLTKLTSAELMNAVISSMFTAFIKTEKGVDPLNITNGIEKKEGGSGEKKNDISMGLGSGTIYQLEPGQDMIFADPSRPNASSDAFRLAMCKELGSSLHIPAEIIMSKFEASYSASKAALEDFWRMIKRVRDWMAKDFCQPIFEEIIDEAVSKGYVDLPEYFENALKRKAYLAAEWYGMAQPSLDPLKEVKASVLKIENGLSTRSRESREINGSDWKENQIQLDIENQMQKKKEVKNNGNIQPTSSD